MNKHIKTLTFFEKNRSNNAIKFNSLQRELIDTLSYDSVRQRKDGMFGIRNSTIRHYKNSLTGKIQKIGRKMREVSKPFKP